MKAVAVTLSIACPEGTVQGGGDQDRALGVLAAFRRELYRCFSKRPDALAELADAVLCKPDRVHMLAELSLEPECRRGHGAVYDAVNCGRVDSARLRWSAAVAAYADLLRFVRRALEAEGGATLNGAAPLLITNVPVIVIAPYDRVFDKTVSNMQEVRARGGELYVFADLDSHFSETPISIRSLFRDEQRRILDLILASTLEEVAARAGVSRATASRVLRGDKKVSEHARTVLRSLYRPLYLLETPGLTAIDDLDFAAKVHSPDGSERRLPGVAFFLAAGSGAGAARPSPRPAPQAAGAIRTSRRGGCPPHPWTSVRVSPRRRSRASATATGAWARTASCC